MRNSIKFREFDDNENELSVQMWTHIWDLHFPHSDYNMFYDIFKFLVLE